MDLNPDKGIRLKKPNRREHLYRVSGNKSYSAKSPILDIDSFTRPSKVNFVDDEIESLVKNKNTK